MMPPSRAILPLILLATVSISALTVQRGVSYQTNGDVCDKVSWTDKSGHTRAVWLIQAGGNAWTQFEGGGATHRIEYNDGAAICDWSDGDLGGFGHTVNHGQWPTGGWLQSRADGYEPATSFAFIGNHHAIWKYRSKMGCRGKGTTPYYWISVCYLFKDGEDQFQYMLTFDTSPIGRADTVSGLATADSRSPYGCINWFTKAIGGNAVASGYEYGTTYRPVITMAANTDSTANVAGSTFDATQQYNLCPFVSGWITRYGADAEIGMVQTRLNTKHHAGSGSNSYGKTGTLSNFGNEFQLAEFQNWSGPRICWAAVGPGGYGQTGVSLGTENYSLSILFGKHSDNSVSRLVSEANAIMNNATLLTATVGKVDTAGIEAIDIPVARIWDKPGFDQVYRNWTVAGENNAVFTTLVVQPGQSLVNPTLVLSKYTASAEPSTVQKNGASLTEGTGYYCSVDTITQTCWVTYLSTFSGTSTMSVTGPTDATGLTLGTLAVAPAAVNSSAVTPVTFTIPATGGASATIDLSGLGGSATAAMSASGGTSFSYTYNVPASLMPRAYRVVASVRSAGGFKQAQGAVQVNAGNLIVYTDAVKRITPGWQACGGAAEATDAANAYEGSKVMRWNAGTSANCFCEFNFDSTLTNIRTFGYLNIAYKGPALQIEILGPGNYNSPAAQLPASAQFSYVSIPVSTFGNYQMQSVLGLHCIAASTGTVYLDNISFSSFPLTGNLPTPATYTLSPQTESFAGLKVCGKRFTITTAPDCSWKLGLFSLKGETIIRYAGKGKQVIDLSKEMPVSGFIIARLISNTGTTVKTIKH